MPVQSIKEELDHNIIRISAESHSAPKTTKEGALVRGLALPFEKTSLNAFTYDTESIKKSYNSLEGKPVLWNHNPEKVIGHVKGVEIKKDGLHYEMDLDSEEKDIIRKMKRGDISSVSIQCVYDEEESYVSEDDVTHAYINEFLELSVVSIPGFSDTTAQFSESFKIEKKTAEPGDVDDAVWSDAKRKFKDTYGHEPKSDKDWAIVMTIYRKMKGENMSKDKEEKEQDKPEGEQESAEIESKEQALEWIKSNAPESVYEKITSEEEDDGDEDEEEEPEEAKETKLEELEKRISKLEKAMSDDEDDEDEEEEKLDEEEDVEAEAKKREEAIKKDKKSVATEGTTGESEEDVEITDTQLKKAISETI